LLEGGWKLTVACPSPADADTLCGAPGVPIGVTMLDVAAGPVPAEFMAATKNMYAVPFVSPLITKGLAAPVAVSAPGFDTTV